jgi:diacylglycerol kinase family enzyme
VAQQSPRKRIEALTERMLTSRDPKRRVLVICNPYATTVSARLKNLIVYALRSRYRVEAVNTEQRGHATELCTQAARDGYDLVIAFGGDGTVNEAVNGLVGTDTPLTCLPGGSANVFCRSIGVPDDVVDATEHLLSVTDDFQPVAVDTGVVNGRHFAFASGVGLDASVVERVDSNPRLKARLRHHYYAYCALTAFLRRYLLNAPLLSIETEGRSAEGVTAVAQNSDPFTYFGKRPIRLCEHADLQSGNLAMLLLKRASVLQLPTLIPRVLSTQPRLVARHPQIQTFERIETARVCATDTELPVQVDGDYIGRFTEITYQIAPQSLWVVS